MILVYQLSGEGVCVLHISISGSAHQLVVLVIDKNFLYWVSRDLEGGIGFDINPVRLGSKFPVPLLSRLLACVRNAAIVKAINEDVCNCCSAF